MRALGLFIFLFVSIARAADDSAAQSARDEQHARAKFAAAHPDSALAQESYAEYLADHGQLRDAVAHWLLAQSIDPQNAAIANSLGGAYLRAGHARESAAQFQRAVAQAHDNAAYHYNLANVEFMLRRDLTAAWQIDEPTLLRKALTEFRAASRLAPHDLGYARAYADAFYEMPDANWSEAKAAWLHVLTLSSDRDFVYLHLARVSLKLDRKKEALAFLDQVVGARHEALERQLRAQANQ